MGRVAEGVPGGRCRGTVITASLLAIGCGNLTRCPDWSVPARRHTLSGTHRAGAHRVVCVHVYRWRTWRTWRTSFRPYGGNARAGVPGSGLGPSPVHLLYACSGTFPGPTAGGSARYARYATGPGDGQSGELGDERRCGDVGHAKFSPAAGAVPLSPIAHALIKLRPWLSPAPGGGLLAPVPRPRTTPPAPARIRRRPWPPRR